MAQEHFILPLFLALSIFVQFVHVVLIQCCDAVRFLTLDPETLMPTVWSLPVPSLPGLEELEKPFLNSQPVSSLLSNVLALSGDTTELQ